MIWKTWLLSQFKGCIAFLQLFFLDSNLSFPLYVFFIFHNEFVVYLNFVLKTYMTKEIKVFLLYMRNRTSAKM